MSCLFLWVSFNFLNILFKLGPGSHNNAAAAKAPQLKVRADSQNLPFIGAAGVAFFHPEYISKSYIQAYSPFNFFQ